MESKVWREMGLTDSEFEKIKEILGREPNYVETGIFAVMWSEHCGYKNSRPVLKLFPTSGPQVLQGPGENAGIVDIGDGQAVVFKIESHNHPSAVEPFQGAATGVGGIIRDIFTMGARPIALLDSLRFGELTEPKVKYLFNGVVGGISAYGNCIGIPTVAGDVFFHPSFEDNPLVNAMCVGLIDHKDIAKGAAVGAGNPVMVVGARTGRDGIHGATFASEELNESSEEKRPAVQVGDPFMEKLLVEACLELIHAGLVIGMQDMGAAGITSSAFEMASRGGSGMIFDVALVPRREEGMTPYEIMLSESQERMLVVPQKGKDEEVKAIFAKWGLNAVVVGWVTDDGIMRIKDGDEIVAELPAKALTDECPVYYREEKEPAYYQKLKEFDLSAIAEPTDYAGVLGRLLASPNIASKEIVYQQYDHMVGVNTVVAPGDADAAVLRVKGTKKGLALKTDCNSRFCYLDPFKGGAMAVAEAARNLVCVGAKPLAITDCLNFGNPEKPEIFWQLRQSALGMSEACRALSTPVIGGNVSLYNETKGEAIFPTPVVGMVGLLRHIDRRCTQGFKDEGDVIILLGVNKGEIGGSEYLAVVHGREAGAVPELDLSLERSLQDCCLMLIEEGYVKSAHDCSEGGLAVTLAESCISGNIGAEIEFDSDLRTDYYLFGESPSQIVISVPADRVKLVLDAVEEFLVPATVLGRIGGQSLKITKNVGVDDSANQTLINVPVPEIEEIWRGAIPCLMKGN